MSDTIAANILKTFTPPTDLKPRFVYLHNPEGRLVATVGVCPGHSPTQALWAIATCNPKDNFCKLTGRLLVTIRLHKKRHIGIMLKGPGLYRRVITAIAKDKSRFCHHATTAAEHWLSQHPERKEEDSNDQTKS